MKITESRERLSHIPESMDSAEGPYDPRLGGASLGVLWKLRVTDSCLHGRKMWGSLVCLSLEN